MSTHYNAFISYKHEPDDIEIAKEVQHGLEYYHFPGKLRKEYGKKRINKVFRDKDELALTNDLTDTIYQALDNSDHLIVVCSTATKKSVWVQKEIEYFLKNHERKDVFTVLVNGEPEDVIPDILMHETELISCDYRLPLKKARKEELPRLVSAMIGCPYGELINRRRLHAIKQLVVIMSVLLFVSALFTVSLLRSAVLIKKSYIKSLNDQSIQLSEAALDLLSDGNRVDALLLMLRAVPGKNNPDIPVTSSAVKALIDTTYAYKTPDNDAYHIMWNYGMTDTLFTAQLSEDGSFFAATDIYGELKVWDTATHSVLLETHDKSTISQISFLPGNKILVWNSNTAITYDIDTGKELYRIKKEFGFISYDSVYVKDNSSFYLCSTNGELAEYAISDGSVIQSFSLSDPDKISTAVIGSNNKSSFPSLDLCSLSVSENGKLFAFTINNDSFGTDVLIFDINTQKTTLVFSSDREIQNLFWSGENTLLFSESELLENRNMLYDKAYMIGENHTELHCYDHAKKQETWHASISYNYPQLTEGFLHLSDENTVVYYTGNTLAVYDLSSGEKKFDCDLGASIANVNDKGNGILNCFTENGGFSVIDTTDKEAKNTISFLFPQGIRSTIDTENGFYLLQTEKPNIIYYEKGAYDDALTLFKQGPTITSVTARFMNDDILAVIYDDAGTPKLCVYDLNAPEACTVVELPEKFCDSEAKIIGINNGIIYVICSDASTWEMATVISTVITDTTLYTIDYRTGETKPLELSKTSDSGNELYVAELCGNELIYPVLNTEEAKAKITIRNLDTGETLDFDCPYDIAESAYTIRYDRESRILYCSGKEDYVINLENGLGTKVDYPADWNDSMLISEVYNGQIYVSDLRTVFALDKNGTLVREYRQDGYIPQNVIRIDTGANTAEVLILYDGFAVRYDAESGEELGEFDTSFSAMPRSRMYHDTKNNTFYISRYPYCMIIDTTDWKELACIQNAYGYDKNNDRFLVFSEEDEMCWRVGYFKHYSAQDLIKKAETLVGDETLSVQLKANYSMDD